MALLQRDQVKPPKKSAMHAKALKNNMLEKQQLTEVRCLLSIACIIFHLFIYLYLDDID